MKNRGLIVAFDRYRGRLKTLTKAASRLGAVIIRAVECDSAMAPLKDGELFDRVLVDAPCSGLGVLRRSPDIKLRRVEGDLSALSASQKALIAEAGRRLKKGGRLVYSVCTTEPEECEAVAEWFLRTQPGFLRLSAMTLLPEACAPLVDKDGFLRTSPHAHSLDGFFAAVFTKTA